MTNDVAALRQSLDESIRDARVSLAETTERCHETEERAEDVTARLRARWQRRTEFMHGKTNAEGAGRSLEQG